jgi:hypothetical protein
MHTAGFVTLAPANFSPPQAIASSSVNNEIDKAVLFTFQIFCSRAKEYHICEVHSIRRKDS